MITGTSSSTGTTGTTTTGSSASLASNFDQFLTLLTTQLRNQSPLDPLNTNEFTAQLVQFAGVEQQLRTNDTLASLLTLNKATATSQAVGFIGSTVTADGTATHLKDGAAEWKVTLPRAANAGIAISDASGNIVYTANTTFTAGEQSFTWDGRTSTGTKAPDGQYSITVNARDTSGAAVTATTEIKGVVDGVDLTGDTPVLKIGATSIALDRVKSVLRPSSGS